MTTADHEAWPRALFVSAGRVRAHDNPNKLFLEMFRLDELERPIRDRPTVWELSKTNRHLLLGGVYSIEAQTQDDGGLLIRPRTAEFVRAHDSAEEVAAWRLRDDAAAAGLALSRKERAMTARAAQLEPFFKELRREYRRSDRLGRRALEMALLAALREETIG